MSNAVDCRPHVEKCGWGLLKVCLCVQILCLCMFCLCKRVAAQCVFCKSVHMMERLRGLLPTLWTHLCAVLNILKCLAFCSPRDFCMLWEQKAPVTKRRGERGGGGTNNHPFFIYFCTIFLPNCYVDMIAWVTPAKCLLRTGAVWREESLLSKCARASLSFEHKHLPDVSSHYRTELSFWLIAVASLDPICLCGGSLSHQIYSCFRLHLYLCLYVFLHIYISLGLTHFWVLPQWILYIQCKETTKWKNTFGGHLRNDWRDLKWVQWWIIFISKSSV